MSDTVAKLERELAELKARSASRSAASRPDTFELEERKKKPKESESREDTVTRLNRELEEMKARSAAKTDAREDTVTRLSRELEEMKARSSAKKTESREDTVTRLSRELEAAREKSASRKAETKEDTVTRLSRELESLREKSASKKTTETREDTVTKLSRELELLKEKSASKKREKKETEEREDTVTRLSRELESLKMKSESKAREATKEDTVARLEAELAMIKSGTTKEYRSKSTRADDTVLRLEEELAKLRVDGETTIADRKKLASAKKEVDALMATSVDDTIARLMREREKLIADIESESDLETKLTEKRREKERILYGIDICFIVDCTGSMSPWINEVKVKVAEVIAQTERYAGNSKCVVRVAFLGYRDYDDNPRFDIVDFLQKEQLEEFIMKLASVGAYGGGDGPEDIAGAFNKSLGLSWKSSTRVIIHIADAPCHGRQFHSMHDDHPAGDPTYDPLNLLELIKKKKIHYYFVEISQYTKQMTDLFSRVYSNSQFNFDVKHLNSASPSELLPAVIASVRDSMAVTYSKEVDRLV